MLPQSQASPITGVTETWSRSSFLSPLVPGYVSNPRVFIRLNWDFLNSSFTTRSFQSSLPTDPNPPQHFAPPHLVDDVSEGEVRHRHPCVAAQRHVDGVVLHAVHVLVQVDQVSHHLQTAWKKAHDPQQNATTMPGKPRDLKVFHQPNSFMARLYSSSKESFMMAHMA